MDLESSRESLEFGYPFWWIKPDEYFPPLSITASITFFMKIGSQRGQILKAVVKPKLTLYAKEITAFVSGRATFDLRRFKKS